MYDTSGTAGATRRRPSCWRAAEATHCACTLRTCTTCQREQRAVSLLRLCRCSYSFVMLLQSPLGVPRTQRAGAQRVQAPNAAALACRSQPSAAPRRAQLASRAAPALRLRPRQRPRGARGLPVASAAEGSSTNGAVVPAGGSASAVAITGVAVFSAAPYVHDFLKGACAAAAAPPPALKRSSRARSPQQRRCKPPLASRR